MSARNRIDVLLLAEATSVLSETETRELEELLGDHPEVDRYAFARPAAAVFLAVGASAPGAMPASLRSRILARVEASLDEVD